MATDKRRRRLPKDGSALWLTSIVVALGAPFLLGGCGKDDPPEAVDPADQTAGMTRNPPLTVGTASLPNVNPDRKNRGDRFRAPEGSLMLVFFGYTFCPDVCPTTLADLRLAWAELTASERKRVEVAMVTVDPERDSAKVLNQYVGHFLPAGSFAAFRTDDRQRLAEVEKKFNAAHELGKPDKDGNYEVAHTAQVYAVDDRGVVRLEWPFASGSEAIAADIRRLLDEMPDRSGPGSVN